MTTGFLLENPTYDLYAGYNFWDSDSGTGPE